MREGVALLSNREQQKVSEKKVKNVLKKGAHFFRCSTTESKGEVMGK